MNTLENNKLIAEFLSVKMHPCETIENFKFLPMEERGLYNGYFIEDLKYHEDWNWLMKVVEKIETLSEFDKLPEFFIMYDNREEFKGWYWSIEVPKKFNKECYKHNNREKTKIEAVYNACVEFIKWYNNQNRVS